MREKTANSEEIVVEVRNLSTGYDDFIVHENLNFEVRRGEIFVILGGSGCGKSTLLKHLIGLNPPLAGEILVNGENLASASEKEKLDIMRGFGVLYQSGALFSSMTIEENVALPLTTFTKLPRRIVESMARVKLSLVDLQGFESFLPGEISGGMKKRAGLARAMALDPEILFFDEPSAGLDPISSAELDQLILSLREETGVTMVIVTHELDSIFTVADRVIILDKESAGIIDQGDPRELRDNSSNEWVKRFLNRDSMKRV
ncbi:MAG: ATP-binding cassette domain-containing protein [Kiritimatiellaeota bacterium]|nr:ATP-binding cassette domain-containing protein [Kiritimatiellota bacterium]